MIRINLLPVRAAQKKEQLRGQLVVLVLSVILVVVACAGVYLSMNLKIDGEQAAIEAKNKEIIRLRAAIGEVGRFKKLQEELRGKLEILDQLKANRSGPVRLLDELNRRVPAKLWITKFSEDSGNISISGVGLNEETVAEFMRSLEASAYYQNIVLKVTEQTKKDGIKLQRFDISAKSESPKS
jgi:type IV pilus assembly protein PilN